jgi:hypothetical protein
VKSLFFGEKKTYELPRTFSVVKIEFIFFTKFQIESFWLAFEFVGHKRLKGSELCLQKDNVRQQSPSNAWSKWRQDELYNRKELFNTHLSCRSGEQNGYDLIQLSERRQ